MFDLSNRCLDIWYKRWLYLLLALSLTCKVAASEPDGGVDNTSEHSDETSQEKPEKGPQNAEQTSPADEPVKAETSDDETPARHPPNGIVFIVLKETDPTILKPLKDALQAQLSDTQMHLVFRGGSLESVELRNLIDKGKLLAAQEDAVGVFWLDANHHENWLLYLVDPKGERVLVRRAGPGLESLTATLESVAVITRGSAQALLEGHDLEMHMPMTSSPMSDAWLRMEPKKLAEPDVLESPQPDDDTKDAPQISSEAPVQPQLPMNIGQARISFAYRGSTFAEEKSWLHGMSLGLGFGISFGLFVGIGYSLIPDIEIDKDNIGSFRVERNPIEISVGYGYRIRPIVIEGQISAVLDLMERHIVTSDSGFRETDDKSALAYGVACRGRFVYFLWDYVAPFATLGIESLFRNFEYKFETEDSGKMSLLSPRPIRFLLEIGFSFYL